MHVHCWEYIYPRYWPCYIWKQGTHQCSNTSHCWRFNLLLLKTLPTLNYLVVLQEAQRKMQSSDTSDFCLSAIAVSQLLHTMLKIWVFMMADTSVEPALGYIQIVPNRDATTILSTVQQHVAPGTVWSHSVVGSDERAAYNLFRMLAIMIGCQPFSHGVCFTKWGAHPECRILLE